VSIYTCGISAESNHPGPAVSSDSIVGNPLDYISILRTRPPCLATVQYAAVLQNRGLPAEWEGVRKAFLSRGIAFTRLPDFAEV
jgi:hypothetical protein